MAGLTWAEQLLPPLLSGPPGVGCVLEQQAAAAPCACVWRGLGVVRHTLSSEFDYNEQVQECIHAFDFVIPELATPAHSMQIGGKWMPMSGALVLFGACSASLQWHRTAAGFLSPSWHVPSPESACVLPLEGCCPGRRAGCLQAQTQAPHCADSPLQASALPLTCGVTSGKQSAPLNLKRLFSGGRSWRVWCVATEPGTRMVSVLYTLAAVMRQAVTATQG